MLGQGTAVKLGVSDTKGRHTRERGLDGEKVGGGGLKESLKEDVSD